MRHNARYGLRVTGLLAILLTGCSGGRYMEMYDLPQEGWNPDEAVVFTFEPSAGTGGTARGGSQWIDLSVRYDDDFPYTALPLEIKGVTPDKRFWTDTVRLSLAAADGQRAGRHYTNHYDLTRRYRSGIRYPQSGEYALSIRQLTGARPLRGIRSIGVVVSGATPVRRR